MHDNCSWTTSLNEVVIGIFASFPLDLWYQLRREHVSLTSCPSYVRSLSTPFMHNVLVTGLNSSSLFSLVGDTMQKQARSGTTDGTTTVCVWLAGHIPDTFYNFIAFSFVE